MATNLDSHFLSVKHFLPNMRAKKWGRFVGISSNMVGLAIPGMSHYIASKMGIIGFMRGVANDVAGDGITANAVLPGLINTLATAPQLEEQKRATWEQQAIKRLGQPDDVTGAVLFLTSNDAAFITGQALVVDGGSIESARTRQVIPDVRRLQICRTSRSSDNFHDIFRLTNRTIARSLRVLRY